MALIPVFWLIAVGKRGAAWWWIAAAFGISWLADTLAHWVDPRLISAVYPVTQAAIIGAVLLSREEARAFVLLLVFAGGLSTALARPEILLHTVAWVGIVVFVWPLPLGRLRAALLVAFGVGWVTWLLYAASPSWTTWGVYQAVRALGIGLFCWAAWRPAPVLRVVT